MSSTINTEELYIMLEASKPKLVIDIDKLNEIAQIEGLSRDNLLDILSTEDGRNATLAKYPADSTKPYNWLVKTP